jgi:hypothetical protein
VTIRDTIETSAKETVCKAFEVTRCAQELFEEEKIPASVLKHAVKLCEAGLPYAAENELKNYLVRSMLSDLFTDAPAVPHEQIFE